MISSENFDELVKKKRKCKKSRECSQKFSKNDTTSDNTYKLSPPKTVTEEPEKSAFEGYSLPSSLFGVANRIGTYTQRLNDLSSQLFNVQSELINFQNRISDGSHIGLGEYVNQGNDIMQQLIYHNDRNRHKTVLHKHLNLDDLRMLYTHAVQYRNNTGQLHPENHPKNPSSTNNKTLLIEAMTEDYELDPMGILQYYHNYSQQNEPEPSQ